MEKFISNIHRFFKNDIDKEVLQELDEKIRKKENLKEFSLIQKIWLVTGIKENLKPSIHFDEIWLKIQNQQTKGKNRFLIPVLRYAAILLIALNIGWWSSVYLNRQSENNNNYQITACPDLTHRITLPDNTIVFLREGASIDYNSDFFNKNRIVKLSGEAYFDVTKNEKLPFIVETKKAAIKVFGTKFNVLADEESNIYQTVLEEGSVSFTTANGREYMLKPEQMIEYSPGTGKIKRGKVNTELYTAWKDGKIIFIDASLPDICEKLEKEYMVEFELSKNKDWANYSFRGTFSKETPIGEVLQMLQISIPMKVSREECFPEADRIYIE